uniref:Uncharacterized protein n=1 Tax=Anopheles minimus TaxID=112268 RepID=A0A182VS22_9DIPT
MQLVGAGRRLDSGWHRFQSSQTWQLFSASFTPQRGTIPARKSPGPGLARQVELVRVLSHMAPVLAGLGHCVHLVRLSWPILNQAVIVRWDCLPLLLLVSVVCFLIFNPLHLLGARATTAQKKRAHHPFVRRGSRIAADSAIEEGTAREFNEPRDRSLRHRHRSSSNAMRGCVPLDSRFGLSTPISWLRFHALHLWTGPTGMATTSMEKAWSLQSASYPHNLVPVTQFFLLIVCRTRVGVNREPP